ncbi:MAG: L,D-transpeptidase family protein, partial [Prevotella sp.]|nr:L,D-transpeptidase family protein [Prevotella sp.]
RGRATDEVNKHIVVNIPSLTLYAYADDSTLTMRVACGSMLTKSPILQSRIYRMDINPQWVIPQSIVKKDIARHAGNTSYFARHRYNICKRPSFRKVNISSVSYQMLMSGKYAVVQEGGEGNSLGRIIFRFMNNCSVYLHDTSSRGVFSREDRRVSHGCIRVQHPYELARFLLGSEDIDLLDKIEYSMTANMRPVMVDSVMVSPDIDKSRLVRSAKVNPKIPIAITYYTVYPDKAGNLIVYDDVYGYDSIIEEHLSGYLQ